MDRIINDNVIIVIISSEYENILNENGMNLSKRLKLFINEDIKKKLKILNKNKRSDIVLGIFIKIYITPLTRINIY